MLQYEVQSVICMLKNIKINGLKIQAKINRIKLWKEEKDINIDKSKNSYNGNKEAMEKKMKLKVC